MLLDQYCGSLLQQKRGICEKSPGQKCRWCQNQVNAWLDLCEGQFLLRPFTQNQISTFLHGSHALFLVEERHGARQTGRKLQKALICFSLVVYMLEALDLIALFTILVRDVHQRHISQRRSVTSVFSLITFFILESHCLVRVELRPEAGQFPVESWRRYDQRHQAGDEQP